MLVQHFLEQSAQRYPDKVGLVCDGRRLTYAELDAMANRLANALITGGVRRGDRVGIYLQNTVEAVIGIFATLKADAVFVPVNPTTKLDKLTYIANNCQMSALLLDARDLAMSDVLCQDVPALRMRVVCGNAQDSASAHTDAIAFETIQQDCSDHAPRASNIDLDLACLIYTSGSTGDPKGVMSDHSNVVFASGSIMNYLENTADDIVITLSPLSFDYGLYQLLMVFRFGGTLVLERGFAYPADVLKRIETERVTGLPGVPTIFALLIQQDLTQYDLSSLRYLSNTAAALPPSHILELQNKFPHARLYSMYGLTETKRTLYLPPDQLRIRPGSVGIAIPGTEVWVEDEQGHRLGAGEIGELVVRGRHVMRGYWNNEEATRARYRPGPTPGERLCYSGDLFKMDDEGYFYFVARKDDIIKSRGEKVAPKEVEIVLYQLPGVTEAAVVGVPDPVLGSAVKAFLVSNNPELTEKAVLAHCRKNLEDFMVPRYVEFRAELPKTSSGKIKKTDLT
jgi:amino acid adenylation domain-containing protein